MQRGDVYWVALDPVVGSEVEKRRPAVVLQNEAANRTSTTVTLVPLTTNLRRVYPFQILIPGGEAGLGRDCKALCEQIRTVSKDRLMNRIGTLPASRLLEIREALERHLWL